MDTKVSTLKNDVKTGARISVSKTLRYADIDIDGDMDELMDSIVPACCSEGCEVEPDGECEHGNPSVLLAMGLI